MPGLLPTRLTFHTSNNWLCPQDTFGTVLCMLYHNMPHVYITAYLTAAVPLCCRSARARSDRAKCYADRFWTGQNFTPAPKGVDVKVSSPV